MEFYDDLIDSSHIQMFMVQSCLLLRGGQENQSEGTPPTFWGGLLIRCWHYHKYVHLYHNQLLVRISSCRHSHSLGLNLFTHAMVKLNGIKGAPTIPESL